MLKSSILKKKLHSVVSKSSDYIWQFVSKDFQYLTQQKKLEYKGINLKCSYLINIVHELIIKYYFSNNTDSKFKLSSIILKKRYGEHYNYYINYLCEQGFMSMVSNYCVGKKTKTYKLNIEYTYDVLRWKNYDNMLLKKINNRYETSITEMSFSSIQVDIRVKIIESLTKVDIDYDGALKLLNDRRKSGEMCEPKYQKNLISIENINSKSIYFNFDDYGRFHTNFTILKKEIRTQYLSIENEMISEIDIKNSQPLFFAVLLKKDLSEINGDTKRYFELVKEGLIYEDIIKNSKLTERYEAKELMYKVLFGNNLKTNKKLNKIFQKLYPSVYEYILEFKENKKNYKELSHELQKMESNFIFNVVLKEIYETYPNIVLFTVHDSIVCSKSNYDKVKVIFDKHFKELIKNL